MDMGLGMGVVRGVRLRRAGKSLIPLLLRLLRISILHTAHTNNHTLNQNPNPNNPNPNPNNPNHQHQQNNLSPYPNPYLNPYPYPKYLTLNPTTCNLPHPSNPQIITIF